MAKHRHVRKLRNYFIDPRVQIRFFVPYFIQLILVAALIEAILYYNSQILREAIPELGPQSSALISEMFVRLTVASAIALVVIAIVGFLILLVQSHRILGPMIPMTRFIRGLTQGQYKNDLVLRKNDEFKVVADELNALARSLRKGVVQINEQAPPDSKSS